MDLCDTTALSFDPSVADMLAYVNSAAATQTVLATDSASLTNGNMDGVSLCGPRTYSISPSSSSILGLSGDTLTLLSTDPADVTTSPISITIRAGLLNYPNVAPKLETFNIEIRNSADPCESMVITAESISDVTLDASEFVEEDVISVTVPFTDFICEDKVTGEADCG